MSSWLEAGRPAVLEAIAAACDEIGQRARAELEDCGREDKQRLEELETLKKRVADVDRLQQENESLRAQISRMQQTNKVSPFPNRRIALGELSPNKPTIQRADVLLGTEAGVPDRAAVKKLITKYQKALTTIEDQRIVAEKRKNSIDEWERHSSSQAETIRKQRDMIRTLRAKLRPSPSSANGGLGAQGDGFGVGGATLVDGDVVETAPLREPTMTSNSQDDIPSSPPVAALPCSRASSLSPRLPVSEPPPRLSTDDTSGHADDPVQEIEPTKDPGLPPYLDQLPGEHPVTVKVELSSDGPLVVSTRSVGKRKHTGDEVERGRVQRIKSEHSSSSAPEIMYESQHSPAESIDYDQEEHVPTPRKRRSLPQHGREGLDTMSEEVPRPRLLFPGQSPSRVSSSSTSDHKASARLHVFTGLSRSGRVPKADTSADSKVYRPLLATESTYHAEDGEVDLDRLQRPVTKMRWASSLLDARAPSKLASTSRDGSSKGQTSRSTLAHDGDDGNTVSTNRKLNASASTVSSNTTAAMLKQIPGAIHSPESGPSRERASKKPSILRDDMPRGRLLTREQTPLRDRPVSDLRPEDFKPNPKYNDNLPYVYDEVVRGRDARASLSGCIDSNCCGKTFRHFAENELRRIGHSLTKRSEEVILMEKYLGHEAFTLTTMSPQEREEAWLKAKTWDLANKFGKHRQRYSRMPTPPGFWNVDWPSTQERAEERRQAMDIRRALVAERYREAMRCNGSWLFRDEEPR
ncbi:unnamed protein product [Discula destructiva]